MDPPYVTSGYCCKYFRFLLPICTHYHLLTLNIRKKLLQIFVFAQMLCCKYQTSKSLRWILQNNCKYYQFLLPKCTHYHFLTNHFIYLNYTFLSCRKYYCCSKYPTFKSRRWIWRKNCINYARSCTTCIKWYHALICFFDTYCERFLRSNSCFLCFAYFFNQTLLQFSFETKSTLVSTKNCNKNSSNFSVWWEFVLVRLVLEVCKRGQKKWKWTFFLSKISLFLEKSFSCT